MRRDERCPGTGTRPLGGDSWQAGKRVGICARCGRLAEVNWRGRIAIKFAGRLRPHRPLPKPKGSTS